MRYFLPFFLLFLPLYAQKKNSSPIPALARSPRKAVEIRRTLDMKHKLDEVLESDSANLLHFFQTQEKVQPAQVFLKKDELYEKEYENEFLVMLDDQGRVRIVIEMPHSQSGDWYLEDRHYYNEEGYIIAYQRYYNRFAGDECGESPYHQFTEILYSSANQNPLSIRRTNKNHLGKNINSGCFIVDSGSMRIFPSWHDMARELNLPDAPVVTTSESGDTH